MGTMVERGTDVVDSGLAGFDVERCGFKEDIGLSFREPGMNVAGIVGRIQMLPINPARIGDPAETARCDSGDAVIDAVAAA